MLADRESDLRGIGTLTRDSEHDASRAPAKPAKMLQKPDVDGPAILSAAMARVVRAGTYLVPLAWIDEDPENEREVYDHSGLIDLGAHIRETGGVNTTAALIRPYTTDADRAAVPMRFMFITGHRRSRAMKLLGAEFIKCEIRDVHDAGEIAKLRFGDNLHANALNPLEVAKGWRQLLAAKKYTSVEAMAQDMGRQREARSIRDLLSLDKLSPQATELLKAGTIQTAHAVQLARRNLVDQAEVIKERLFEQHWGEGNVVVSEKSLRESIKRMDESRKWKAEREAEERKEAEHIKKLKAAGKLESGKTPEQVKAAREKAKRIEEGRKERERLDQKLVALLQCFGTQNFDEANLSLPTSVLRQLAADVQIYEPSATVIEKRFQIPNSRLRREDAIKKTARGTLIAYLTAAIGMTALVTYDKSKRKMYDVVADEVKTAHNRKAKAESAAKADTTLDAILKEVIVSASFGDEAGWSATTTDARIEERLKKFIAPRGKFTRPEFVAHHGAHKGTPWIQIDQKGNYTTIRGAEIVTAVRRVFGVKEKL